MRNGVAPRVRIGMTANESQTLANNATETINQIQLIRTKREISVVKYSCVHYEERKRKATERERAFSVQKYLTVLISGLGPN